MPSRNFVPFPKLHLPLRYEAQETTGKFSCCIDFQYGLWRDTRACKYIGRIDDRNPLSILLGPGNGTRFDSRVLICVSEAFRGSFEKLTSSYGSRTSAPQLIET